ncbi:Hsp20/alpha crystallin family protein [Halorarum salinum]|uniref:Hsp20/alpha crystallin family protein n=1 Tax=Halorarum salinum TaxID=2743089 RepID=A0A7D5Q9E0_9EURY|nr:Hsp20/alpha crystallin family protein [Halobaculum salinum]QLG60858.1 Hsp20/alpha crystallin family protein [Halobaculum salinum]
MALPTSPTSNWTRSLDLPYRLFGTGGGDYELYEEDDDFVLTVELPGFEREEIEVNWFEGRLNVSAERDDEARNRRKTYHRTFRMPKEIEPDEIEAAYRNGVLEVRLPVLEGATTRGTSIEVQ